VLMAVAENAGWLILLGAGAMGLLWGGVHWRRRKASAPEAVRIPPTLEGAETETDLTSALYTAARNGQGKRALELLDAGANPHAPPPAAARDQRSLIALASVLPELALLRALIARGVDINHAHAGMTALIAATRDSWHGRPDAVMVLLTNGADPHLADAEGNTPLHHAARSIDPSVAALLCDAGADIQARNHEGVTPLGMACVSGNWRLAKFLIEHGARPDPAESSPALLSAAATETDDPAGVELLLKHRARVNSRDTRNRSALHEAALHGHVGIIQTLLAAGAETDARDMDGQTPLLEAVRGGHLEALNVLLSTDLDVHAPDACGRNALTLACLAERPSLALVQRLLEAGVAADDADHAGKTALDHAVNAGHWTLVKCLDPTWPLPPSVVDGARDESPQPPLELLRTLLRTQETNTDECDTLATLLNAEQLGALLLDADITVRLESLQWVLAQGVDPNQPDADGHTLLDRLLCRLPDTLPAVQVLLQHDRIQVGDSALAHMLALCLRGHHTGAALEQCALDLATRNSGPHPPAPDHSPPLTLAVRLGWDRLLEHLASTGVDLDARDRQGLAALHLAAALGRERTLRLLLRHGATLDLRTQDGQTPLGIALAAGHRPLADWLDWRGWPLPGRALRPEDVPAAAATGDSRAVLRLLDLGLPLDATDQQGCTALLRAAGSGHLELVSHLVERGAALHQPAHSGATALSAAVSMGHAAIITRLLRAGADLEYRLPGGFTVLMLAAARGLPDTCQQLLHAGADIHARNDQGWSALHCAAHYGFSAAGNAHLTPLLAVLLAAGADCNTTTSEDLTPLLLLLGARATPGNAADESTLDAALAQLLEAGSRIEVQERRHGYGPLHLSALHGLSRPTCRLLRAGADPELRDLQGRPARAIAIARGFIDIATELTQPLNRSDISMARFLNGRE